METNHYPHFPLHLRTVHIALYTEVTNSPELRSRIIKAATLEGPEGDHERDVMSFAFVNARLITSRLHLQTAIYQAMLASAQGSLRTKTVHSEILWALNPSNNISEAIRRFGFSDASSTLFVIRIGSPNSTDIVGKMNVVVHGKISPMTALEQLIDWISIKKYHKLNAESAVQDTLGDLVAQHAVVDNIVVSSVAMKSVLA